MLDFSFFAYADSVPAPAAGEPETQAEITAELDIAFDVGDGDILTES
jgi:hypothetical protein